MLGSLDIPESDIGNAGASPEVLDPNLVTANYFDLAALGIDVQAGDALAFRLTSARELPALFAMRTAFDDPYAGGALFNQSGYPTANGIPLDAAFKTFVNAVPVPPTAALLALGLLAAAPLRRRFR